MWKFHKKKMFEFFLFHFLKKRHFTCTFKSTEIGIIEGAIALILKYREAHFDL